MKLSTIISNYGEFINSYKKLGYSYETINIRNKRHIEKLLNEVVDDIILYNEFLDNESLSTFNTTPLGACSSPLNSLHEFSAGTVTLGVSGNLTYTYNITNITTVKITITGRSSAEPLPIVPNNFTIINNS